VQLVEGAKGEYVLAAQLVNPMVRPGAALAGGLLFDGIRNTARRTHYKCRCHRSSQVDMKSRLRKGLAR
jgi:hypothetical protein